MLGVRPISAYVQHAGAGKAEVRAEGAVGETCQFSPLSAAHFQRGDTAQTAQPTDEMFLGQQERHQGREHARSHGMTKGFRDLQPYSVGPGFWQTLASAGKDHAPGPQFVMETRHRKIIVRG